MKALGMGFSASPCSNDKCENDQANDDQNLHTGEPELEFSEDTNAEVIDRNNRSEEKRHVQRRMTCWAGVSMKIEPVLDD
jgi:hypothetical protein